MTSWHDVVTSDVQRSRRLREGFEGVHEVAEFVVCNHDDVHNHRRSQTQAADRSLHSRRQTSRQGHALTLKHVPLS